MTGRDPGRRRVVITGIGLVTSLGIGRDENWTAALAGRSGAATISSFVRRVPQAGIMLPGALVTTKESRL